MKTKNKLTKAKKKQVKELMKLMTPVAGEQRNVCECDICGQLFGRRFIPYGLGYGFTINPCSCMVTNSQHGKFTVLKTKSP